MSYDNPTYEELLKKVQEQEKEIKALKSNQNCERKNLFQTLFIDSYSIKLIIDFETGQIINANKSACKFYGYSHDEITSMNIKQINTFPPEEIRKEMQNAKLDIKNNFNFKHRLKNGQVKDVEVHSGKIIIENKLYLYSIIHDVTGNKQKESELENSKLKLIESEKLYRDTFNHAAIGISHIAPNGRFLKVNQKFCDIIGYTQNELKKLNFADITHPDDLELDNEQIEKVIANKINSFTITKRYIHKNGKIVWINLYSNVIRKKNNQIKFAIASILDVTEQKKLQDKLIIAKEKAEESERKYKLIAENTSDGIFISNADGKIDFASKSYCKQFGYNENEILNRTPKDIYKLIHPNERDSLFKEIYQAIKSKKSTLTYSFRAKHKNGHYIWREDHAKFHYDKKGKLKFTNVICRDITERKKYLEEIVIAKEKAEEANRLKTEFLNNMSHEIRTPVNGIVGFSRMLDKPKLSTEKRNYYSRIIQSSSNQLLKIIDDILEISTLETKQTKLYETELCLNDLLMELFSIFNLNANTQKIPIYIKKALHDNESYIVSDKTKLNKIISNLLENALKFTTEGFIELGYFIKKQILTLYVRDTGIGISRKYYKQIFERFSQEEKEMSRKHGGLGLGLSISKENAQLLGGDITLESEKGKGSTFYVNIPYKPVKTKDAKIFNSNSIPEKNAKFTILVAEDEDINYLYIEALFEEEMEADYEIIHAKNGKEAVDLCLKHKNIDLVLMDIKMPEMNGHEATEKIKTKLPNLPIIAQTAYSTDADRELALKHGCNDFITKPLDIEKLTSIINKYLNDN